MTKKSNLGIIVGTKEYAYWHNVVKNLEIEVDNLEKSLKYAKFCLVNSENKLLSCSKPLKA